MQTILHRIEALEKENTRLRRVAVVFALLGVIVLGMAQAKPKPLAIEAEQLVIRDGRGRARVTIGTPASGGAAVGLSPDEPAIWITDEKGQDRAILSSDGLRFADEKGKRLATYSATAAR
jgi:hypothetical protein